MVKSSPFPLLFMYSPMSSHLHSSLNYHLWVHGPNILFPRSNLSPNICKCPMCISAKMSNRQFKNNSSEIKLLTLNLKHILLFNSSLVFLISVPIPIIQSVAQARNLETTSFLPRINLQTLSSVTLKYFYISAAITPAQITVIFGLKI